MQLAGWIGTTEIHWLHLPGWMGTWFSLFNNWETFIGQFIAIALVVGSYFAAQYLRVWRPRKRGLQAARRRRSARPRSPPTSPSPARSPASTAEVPALARHCHLRRRTLREAQAR